MKLSHWLAEQGISQADFARACNTTRSCVNLWAHGKRIPEPDRIRTIRELTEGAVDLDDWR